MAGRGPVGRSAPIGACSVPEQGPPRVPATTPAGLGGQLAMIPVLHQVQAAERATQHLGGTRMLFLLGCRINPHTDGGYLVGGRDHDIVGCPSAVPPRSMHTCGVPRHHSVCPCGTFARRLLLAPSPGPPGRRPVATPAVGYRAIGSVHSFLGGLHP